MNERIISFRDSIRESRFTFAIVFKGTVEQAERVREAVIREGASIIFQRTSAGKLWIKEDTEERGEQQ